MSETDIETTVVKPLVQHNLINVKEHERQCEKNIYALTTEKKCLHPNVSQSNIKYYW